VNLVITIEHILKSKRWNIYANFNYY